MNNLKLMAVKGLLKVDKFYQKNKKKLYSAAAAATAALTVATPVAAEGEATSGLINFGTIDLTALTDTISAAIPAALPTVVILLGARKGISLFTGLIRGA